MLQSWFSIATLLSRFFRAVAVLAAVAISVMQAAAAETSPRGEPRRDLHGDPLPRGAVARLGTIRYRVGDRGYWVGSARGRIEFLNDSRTLMECSGGRLLWLDADTGCLVQSINLGADRLAVLLAVTRDRTTAAVRTYRFPKHAAAGRDEFQIVLIDTSSGEERTRLPAWKVDLFEQPEPATCAAFTPDGRRLAVGDDAGGLRVWNVIAGREEKASTMPGAGKVPRGSVVPPPETVRSVAFAANGKWLVAASRQETVRWKWQDDAPPEPMGPAEPVQTMELAPDGELVAIMSGWMIRLFDVATGRQVRELTVKAGIPAPQQLAFTSDGSRLVVPTFSLDRVDIWNVRNGELERTLPFALMGLPRGAHKATVSPDDRRVAATAVADAPLAVWDLETGERVGDERVGHIQRINRLTVSPDGSHVLTAGYDGLVIVWHAESGRPVHVFRPERERTLYQGLAFSPDGKWIATSARNEVVIRDRESGQPVSTLTGHDGYRGPRLLRFTPDSAKLLSFGEDWFLRAFDVRTGKTVREHAIRPAGVPLNEQPDGSVTRKAVRYGRFAGWEPSPAKASEFTRDGKSLVLLSGDKVHLFDVETGQERAHYAIGRTSRRLLRMMMDEDEAHWADEEAAELNRFIAISPDGQQLATVGIREATESSRKYVLQIRRLEDGKVTVSFPLRDPWHHARMPGLRGPSIAFLPCGSRIATASRSIDVYDIAAGRLVARIDTAANGLIFTPDGERLVTFSADTTALVWQWQRFLIAEPENLRDGDEDSGEKF